MSTKSIGVLGAAIVNFPQIIPHSIALPTRGSDLIPIPQVGGYGLLTPGLRVTLNGRNAWRKFYIRAQPVKTALNNAR